MLEEALLERTLRSLVDNVGRLAASTPQWQRISHRVVRGGCGGC